MELNDISEVRIGWKSDNFNKIESRIQRRLKIKKFPDINEDNCFSLVFENSTENIDLVAPDCKTRDLWVKGIDYLIAANNSQKKENRFEWYFLNLL